MPDYANWKDALLYSSMPLEFEAARLLVSEGFAISPDFKYAWNDSEIFRDAAVDIHARGQFPFTGTDTLPVQVELLVDCEHRAPAATGLFLPDIHPEGASPVSPGNIIRMMDQFSPYVISQKPGIAFDEKLPVCYKGMEIDIRTGEVDETVFRQGLWRLQNTLPRLMTENILGSLGGPPEQNVPFVFCPVLLTTSPLFVLRQDVTLAEIRDAADVGDVGTQQPWLVMSSDYSPDFRKRCIAEFDRLKPLLRTDEAMRIEMKKVRHYNTRHNLPFTIIDALNDARYYYLNLFFTRFIICRNTEFPRFLDELQNTVRAALETGEAL